MIKLKEDSLLPGLLFTVVAFLVAALGPEKAARTPSTDVVADCDGEALTLCTCELLPVVRPGYRVLPADEVVDCNLLDATQSGVSNVYDIERIGRTDRLVAEAAGPFRSEVDAPDPFDTRSSTGELAQFGAQFAAEWVAAE